jgi:magnesium transporter
VREVAEQEQPETEPKADAIRGTAALIRRISVSRQKMEEQEARRLREEKLQDQLEPLRENEEVHWDGLRRRKTVIGERGYGPPVRRKTLHPPLGMSHFPEPEDDEHHDEEHNSGFFENLRHRTTSIMHPQHAKHALNDPTDTRSPMHPVALTEINVHGKQPDTPIVPYGPGSLEEAEEHIYGLPPSLRNQTTAYSPRSKPLPKQPSNISLAPNPPPHGNRRQFSFTNVFSRKSNASRTDLDEPLPPPSRAGMGSRGSSSHDIKRAMKNATEEERLGLVRGDSHHALLSDALASSPPRQTSPVRQTSSYPYTYDDDELSTPPLAAAYATPEDEESDGWQMTNATPSNPSTQSRSPPRARPIPPPLDLRPSAPPIPTSSHVQPSGRKPAAVPALVPAAAGQGRFQTSSTNPNTMTSSASPPPSYPGSVIRDESPESYEYDEQTGGSRGRGII